MVSHWVAGSRAPTSYHARMETWPAHVDPLDRAILDLLCSLPATWRDHDRAGLTATEEQAFRLMEEAGLVERRLDLRATMDGRTEAIEFICIVSGEKIERRIWEHIFKMLSAWLDKDGRTRGRVQLECRGVQVRLSDQGEVARHDYENQTPENPSCVCAFVRRLGFAFAHRPPVTPTFRVESCRVDSAPPAGSASATAAAAAQASVGDITINNVIQMDESAVVERILAAMDNRMTPPVPVSETPAGDGGSEGIGDGVAAAEPPPDMKPAVRRAGASFEKVEVEQPDLSPPANSPVRYTERQWAYIRDHYDEIYPPDASGNTTIPAYETWGRYVREYLRLTEGPKNSPRGGRPLGRSVVRQKDLDQSRRDADD